jgi:RNA polymerase sigma-70 factor (ECF subfamily)
MDAEEFAASTIDLYVRLARAAYLLCGDRELAEECAQEALTRAWQRISMGETIDSLPAWTTTVALNWARSQLRRRGVENRALRRFAPRRHEPEAPAPAGALSADVHQAVLALPLRQREVVILFYFLDQDVATIAATAGISAGAVKNALFNARAALAARLGTHDSHALATNGTEQQR